MIDLLPRAIMDTGQYMYGNSQSSRSHSYFRPDKQLAPCFYCLLLFLGKACALPTMAVPQSCSRLNYSCKFDFYCQESIGQCVLCTVLSDDDCQYPTSNLIPCYDNHDTACSECEGHDEYKEDIYDLCHLCTVCDKGEKEISPCGPFHDRRCGPANNISTIHPTLTSNWTLQNSSMTPLSTIPTQQNNIVTIITTTWNYLSASLQTSFHSSGIQTPPPTLNSTIHEGGSSSEVLVPVIIVAVIGGVIGVIIAFLIIAHKLYKKRTGSCELENVPQVHMSRQNEQAGASPRNSTLNRLQQMMTTAI